MMNNEFVMGRWRVALASFQNLLDAGSPEQSPERSDQEEPRSPTGITIHNDHSSLTIMSPIAARARSNSFRHRLPSKSGSFRGLLSPTGAIASPTGIHVVASPVGITVIQSPKPRQGTAIRRGRPYTPTPRPFQQPGVHHQRRHFYGDPKAALRKKFEKQWIAERCRAEVVDMTRFIQDWHNKKLAKSRDVFDDGFTSVLAADFVKIQADGTLAKFVDLTTKIYDLHASHEAPKNIQITIEDFQHHQEESSLHICTYIEKRKEFDVEGQCVEESRRRFTVVFRNVGPSSREEDDPMKQFRNGLSWVHAQETILEDPAALPS